MDELNLQSFPASGTPCAQDNGGETRAEARKLLQTWLKNEEEAAEIQRRTGSKCAWPEGQVKLSALRPPRPSRSSGHSIPDANEDDRNGNSHPTLVSQQRSSSSSCVGPANSEGSSSSRPVQRMASSRNPALVDHLQSFRNAPSAIRDSGIQEDVDIAMGLIVNQHANGRSSSNVRNSEPEPARRIVRSCSPADPTLRMQMRQEEIKARRRERELTKLLPPETTPSSASGSKISRSHRPLQVGTSSSSSGLRSASSSGPHQPRRSSSAASMRSNSEGRTRDVKEVRQAAADSVIEVAQLSEEVNRARQEVEKEAQAYRELVGAQHAKQQQVAAKREVEGQLDQLQMQRRKARDEQRTVAIARLVLALGSLQQHHCRLSKRAVISRLVELRFAVLSKLKRFGFSRRLALLHHIVRVWKSTAAGLRDEREHEMYKDMRAREQRREALASTFHTRGLCRRSWLTWNTFVRWSQDEKASEALRLKAQRFVSHLDQASRPYKDLEHAQGSDVSRADDFSVLSAINAEASVTEGSSSMDYRAASTSARAVQLVVPQHPFLASEAPCGGTSKVDEFTFLDPEEDHASYVSASSVAIQSQRPALSCEDNVHHKSFESGTKYGCTSRADDSTSLGPEEQSSHTSVSSSVVASAPQHDYPSSSVIEEVPRPQKQQQVRRPRIVTEMEKRAEEQQRKREEMRERHRLKEEQKRAEAREAEEALLLAEREAKLQQVRERKERDRLKRVQEAQRIVDVEIRKGKEQKARQHWAYQKVVDAWCSWLRVVQDAEERAMQAFLYARSALVRKVILSWRSQHIRQALLQQVCHTSLERMSSRLRRRHMFRQVVKGLQWMGEVEQGRARRARASLAKKGLQRALQAWQVAASELGVIKTCNAMRQYSLWLARRSIAWWLEGKQRARLDAQLESHKAKLWQKVNGWLEEMDSA